MNLMAIRVHPLGFRLGTLSNHYSIWFTIISKNEIDRHSRLCIFLATKNRNGGSSFWYSNNDDDSGWKPKKSDEDCKSQSGPEEDFDFGRELIERFLSYWISFEGLTFVCAVVFWIKQTVIDGVSAMIFIIILLIPFKLLIRAIARTHQNLAEYQNQVLYVWVERPIEILISTSIRALVFWSKQAIIIGMGFVVVALTQMNIFTLICVILVLYRIKTHFRTVWDERTKAFHSEQEKLRWEQKRSAEPK